MKSGDTVPPITELWAGPGIRRAATAEELNAVIRAGMERAGAAR